jgi:ABC-type dipeptide/oligopeptide/nickel transport system permease subunit
MWWYVVPMVAFMLAVLGLMLFGRYLDRHNKDHWF